MVNPVYALIGAGVIALLIVAVFWPEKGLLARWERMQMGSLRVNIEDALKHVYDCEYKKLSSTHASLAGSLSISADEASTLLGRLESMGLLRSRGETVDLTDQGRSYALRIIRTHRLWERYLADETGLHETQWHQEAERQEHRMTADQANALSAQMGHPRFDPHGDPIPTAGGEMPRLAGVQMSQLGPGSVARIIHIEDEPPTVYAQLVAQGLFPGMLVRVHGRTHEKITFDADGEEGVLAPIIAANVTVAPLMREEPAGTVHDSLDSLRTGERGRVIGISRACRGQQRRRLMDLGVIPGTVITAEMKSASGDPVAYSIRGATIALRKRQSSMIHISKERET